MLTHNIENLQPIHWVVSAEDLQELCKKWSQQSLIAVDTEFMRTNTYYPKPALIQINDGEANYLIDPVAIVDMSAMSELMQNGAVQKVLHSCSEDLEVFNTLLGCLPVNLYDTQIAAAFCGYGFSVGYAGLVELLLGIEVPKGETRSNWLQRPLSDGQVKYAALDVEYLFTIASMLKKKLASTPQEGWVSEECLSVFDAYNTAQNPANGLQRFKSAWKLNSLNLAVLSALSEWREGMAKERNLPRNFVVKERALFQIAETMPLTAKQFKAIEDFSDKSALRYGKAIIAIVEQAQATDESQLPQKLPRPLSSAQKTLLKKIREQMQTIAEPLKIAPEYLARKKDFEYIVRSVSSGLMGDKVFPESFSGWRDGLVKNEILALL